MMDQISELKSVWTVKHVVTNQPSVLRFFYIVESNPRDSTPPDTSDCEYVKCVMDPV